MKVSRSVMSVVAVAGFVLLLSSASFADEGMEKGKVKILNESAAALLQSNPGLSAALTAYANEETNEMKSEKAEMKEMKEMKEKAEPAMMAEREAHMKLLKDAAVALKTSNPDLSDRLTKMAEKHEKRMEKKEMKAGMDKPGDKMKSMHMDKK